MAITLEEVTQYVENNIGDFHKRKLDSLNLLSLTVVLRKKNPYLFKVKSLITPADIVKALVDAHLSSQEETIFGNWLEGLAIFINGKVFGGKKSSTTGIDLEFSDGSGTRYIVAIKSGPNWGNASQITKMKDNFTSAKRTLRTSNSKVNIIAVNGCCYGRENNPDKGEYFKYCGQKFWYFISGNNNLYLQIIEPLGHKAKANTDIFNEAYAKVLTQFTANFTELFCKKDYSIDWEKLTKHNSSESVADIVKIVQPKKVKARFAEASERADWAIAKPRHVAEGSVKKKTVKKTGIKKPKK